MDFKIDSEKILEQAASADDRKKISLYLSGNLYRRFQRICKKRKAKASRVMELLLDEFLMSIEDRENKQ